MDMIEERYRAEDDGKNDPVQQRTAKYFGDDDDDYWLIILFFNGI